VIFKTFIRDHITMAYLDQSQSGQDERWRADPIESKMAVEFSIPLSASILFRARPAPVASPSSDRT
jgi:hypothetical protein